MVAHLQRQACAAASAIGRRLAVAGGALVALLALLRHAPLWLACACGSATLLALALGTRLSVAALTRSMHLDRERAARKEVRT